MSVVDIGVKVLSGGIGTMLTAFTGLNLFSDIGNPFGTFGTKFIYEMDEIMGGQVSAPSSPVRTC